MKKILAWFLACGMDTQFLIDPIKNSFKNKG